ncbi:putative SEG-like homing endonuclease [Stenotrophomonas maltophilia phage vB_SmaM_Ps15]|uniref:SEG-like homing endonuclease n=1 Tax=Stenotrophomonas maltophilia phage vB_SmaM_Ps15 TaxID=3071007 RepID=A0AAE9FLL7_9CAUD|nr:putative SEG-like homing endonuclease [Stenotrophomonas maltophilia phage vB_SmaM_Ps15]UMO77240.1 putative SEG-like homing endonuclease [Stenotrophomonas maltophilia phage vB_SmaM_Ps15]
MNRYGHQCYTYLIGWRELDVWYYGYRSANRVAPDDDLMIEYFTSSGYVEAFIRDHGIPDVIRVHKTFGDRSEALRYEERFLDRVNATESSRWLNKSNRGKFHTPAVLPVEWRESISKGAKGNTNGKGPRSQNFKARMKEFNVAKASDPEFREKLTKARNSRPVEASGWVLTEATKTKMRKPKPVLICPHCGATGGAPAMTRWHFDNCKGHKNA